MSQETSTPQPLRQPDPERKGIWKRIGVAIIMAALVGVSASVLTWCVLNYFVPREPAAAPVTVAIRPPQPPAIIPTLTVWGCGTENEESLWREAIQIFESEQRCAIFFQAWRNQNEFDNAISTTLGTPQGPDIVLTRQSLLEGFRRRQLIRTLPWNDQDIMSWVPATIEAVRCDGGVLALPCRFSVPVLYYNPQLFDMVGIAHPDTHWTWENLLAIARVMLRPSIEGQAPERHGLEAAINVELWNTLSLQAGGPLWGDRLKIFGGAGSNEPQSMTLQWLIELIQNYSVWTPTPQAPLSSRFENGQSAMLIGGADFLPRLRSQTTVRWNVAPLPKFKEHAVTLDVTGWCIAQKTSDFSAALNLARRLTKATDRTLHLPAFQPDPVHLITLPTSVFYDQLQYARPLPNHPMSLQVQKIVNQSLRELSGETNSSGLLTIETMNKRIEESPDWRIYQKQATINTATNPTVEATPQ